MTKFLGLEDLTSYKLSSDISDYIWKIVSNWNWFDKRTLGVQLVDAVDSIAANIAEGYGRFHKKDKIKFFFNSRGSLIETIHWINKATDRKLITEKEYQYIYRELEKLPKEINNLIRLTNINLKK